MLSSLTSQRLRPFLLLHLHHTQILLYSSLPHTVSTKPISIQNPTDPIPQSNSPIYDYTTVRETLSSYCNDWKKALDFFNWVETDCHFQLMDEILRLFDRMIESRVQPRMDTYVMIMRKFGRWGFLRPMFIVWQKMEKLGCSPNESAYNALIDALVEKGMLDMARKYDEEMIAKGLSARPRVELGTKLVSNESDDG